MESDVSAMDLIRPMHHNHRLNDTSILSTVSHKRPSMNLLSLNLALDP